PQALRDLSVSLNNVGAVERDLGNLEAARAAYRESLDIARRLREAVGDTPQALRDLSISLNNVGAVERDLGNLEAARTAWRESLELMRRLCRTFPDNPGYRRNLAAIEARAKTAADPSPARPPREPAAPEKPGGFVSRIRELVGNLLG
ncbi:MAG: tetratricopeptide repeat protein, partial [Stellaceae bacterium]